MAPNDRPESAWQRLDELRLVLPLIKPTDAVLDSARAIQADISAHYWDCLLFAACLDAGVTRLYTEDVPGGRFAGWRSSTHLRASVTRTARLGVDELLRAQRRDLWAASARGTRGTAVGSRAADLTPRSSQAC